MRKVDLFSGEVPDGRNHRPVISHEKLVYSATGGIARDFL
jgi:hypothetical protein